MSHLAKLMKLFARDESGAALVEYAVIFAVVIAGTITAFGLMQDQIVAVFTAVTTILTNVAAGTI